MAEAWWPQLPQLPFSVSVTTVNGDLARGQPMAAAVHKPAAHLQLHLPSPLPLVPGSRIVAFRLAGPFALEVHATEPPPEPLQAPGDSAIGHTLQALAQALPPAMSQQVLPPAGPSALLLPASLPTAWLPQAPPQEAASEPAVGATDEDDGGGDAGDDSDRPASLPRKRRRRSSGVQKGHPAGSVNGEGGAEQESGGLAEQPAGAALDTAASPGDLWPMVRRTSAVLPEGCGPSHTDWMHGFHTRLMRIPGLAVWELAAAS